MLLLGPVLFPPGPVSETPTGPSGPSSDVTSPVKLLPIFLSLTCDILISEFPLQVSGVIHCADFGVRSQLMINEAKLIVMQMLDILTGCDPSSSSSRLRLPTSFPGVFRQKHRTAEHPQGIAGHPASEGAFSSVYLWRAEAKSTSAQGPCALTLFPVGSS